jgi:putative transposase
LYTEELVLVVLKDAQTSMSVLDLCRKNGIADAEFYMWQTEYVGLEVSDVKKLRQLEEEN